MPAVSVKEVSKKYRIFPNDRARIKEALSFGRKKYGKDYWALNDINLEVEPGTALGILGRNGAGKSTLLNIISGILEPTSGTVEVDGRLITLAAVGALGFSPDMTGRENILLNGLIMGLERQEIVEHFDDIADFAEIGEFMDQPIKTYSSGMRSRLGFAVAANVEPDILVLDETLAAGDEVYKQRAMQKLQELRDSGTTILLVSHSMSTVKDLCTEAILLHKGRVMATGETTEVINRYEALVSSIRDKKKRQKIADGQTPDDVVASREALEGLAFKENSDFERRVANLRSGTGKVRIRGVELLDEHLHPVRAVVSGSTVNVRVYLEYLEAVKDSELIIALHDKAEPEQTKGQEGQFYGPNLGYVLELYERYREDPESVDKQTCEFFENWSPPQPEVNGQAPSGAGELFSVTAPLEAVPLKDKRMIVDFAFEVPLRKGHYNISVGARAGGEDSYLDRISVATTFRIKRPRGRNLSRGIVNLPTEIKVHTLEDGRHGRSA